MKKPTIREAIDEIIRLCKSPGRQRIEKILQYAMTARAAFDRIEATFIEPCDLITTRKEPCGHCGREVTGIGEACPACGDVRECFDHDDAAPS